jgi:hypothetical protein
MYNKYPRLNIAFLLLLLTLSFSCMSVSKYVSRVEMNTSIVPPDFNPSKHILLFAEMPRLNYPDQRNNSVTNKLDKALKEYCPYKYEIVSPKDIYEKRGKYADTSVYKYAILNSLNSVWNTTKTTTTITDNTGTHSTSVSPSARTTYIDFGFYDRTKDNRYPNSGASTAHIDYTVAAFMAIIKKSKRK